MQIDTRWSGGDAARLRRDAADLIALGPDVIVAGVGPTVAILQQASRSVPIVLAQAVDPVGAGFVTSLARPGGNTTGFIQFEYGLSGKWLELFKEIAPRVRAWASSGTQAGWDRTVGRHPGLGVAVGCRVEPDQRGDAGETERDWPRLRESRTAA